MKTKLVIHSVNPDVCGTWNRKDVEEDMREVGCKWSDKAAWIHWILEHVFGFSDGLDGFTIQAICGEHFKSINLDLPCGKTTIEVS